MACEVPHSICRSKRPLHRDLLCYICAVKTIEQVQRMWTFIRVTLEMADLCMYKQKCTFHVMSQTVLKYMLCRDFSVCKRSKLFSVVSFSLSIYLYSVNYLFLIQLKVPTYNLYQSLRKIHGYTCPKTTKLTYTTQHLFRCG